MVDGLDCQGAPEQIGAFVLEKARIGRPVFVNTDRVSPKGWGLSTVPQVGGMVRGSQCQHKGREAPFPAPVDNARAP